MKPLLNAEQAAVMLGLYGRDRKPLRTWVLAEARANRIPHVRLGRYVRFDEDELAAWATQRLRGPRAQGSRDNGPPRR